MRAGRTRPDHTAIADCVDQEGDPERCLKWVGKQLQELKELLDEIKDRFQSPDPVAMHDPIDVIRRAARVYLSIHPKVADIAVTIGQSLARRRSRSPLR